MGSMCLGRSESGAPSDAPSRSSTWATSRYWHDRPFDWDPKERTFDETTSSSTALTKVPGRWASQGLIAITVGPSPLLLAQHGMGDRHQLDDNFGDNCLPLREPRRREGPDGDPLHPE